MVKSLTSIISFIALSIMCLPFANVNQAVFSSNGKSSGVFIQKEDLTVENLFSLDGISYPLSNCGVRKTISLLNAKEVHYFTDGEVKNYYFFSEKLPKCEIINGKKVNFHVAVKGDKITVGSPIIYYGY